MRESFIFYRSFYEAIKDLPVENQLNVYDALFDYALNYNEAELSGIERAIFSLIKPQLDANNYRYENGCKGGRPKKENLEETKAKPKQNQTETKAKPNENENVNENDNENDNVNDNNISPSGKVTKQKYGEYKNVLLKEEEYEKLKTDYPNYLELIQYLDEYIEMKGYKAKSHYLAIRKWVVDAVAEKDTGKKRENQRVYPKKRVTGNDRTIMDFSQFYDNLREG